jgi:hypothetical protein
MKTLQYIPIPMTVWAFISLLLAYHVHMKEKQLADRDQSVWVAVAEKLPDLNGSFYTIIEENGVKSMKLSIYTDGKWKVMDSTANPIFWRPIRSWPDDDEIIK